MTTLKEKIEQLKARTKELQKKEKARERAEQRAKEKARNSTLLKEIKTRLISFNNDEKLLLSVLDDYIKNKQQ